MHKKSTCLSCQTESFLKATKSTQSETDCWHLMTQNGQCYQPLHSCQLDNLILPSSANSNPFSWKTLLFLPQFAFQKSQKTEADCFIIDFQDAVPLPVKAAAREGFKKALSNGEFGNIPILIRINEIASSHEQMLDLDAVVGQAGVTALMPTMIEHPRELNDLHT
jgi:hypothetical protein